VSNYDKYRNTLSFEGITFPVGPKEIPKFEALNTHVSVNVISIDDDHKGFCVEHLSAERNRQHHINLLLLSDANTGTRHYVWIKHFSRLLGDRTKCKSQSYVCNSCLNVFSSEQVLESHIPHCLIHLPQQVVYPSKNSEKSKLKFHDVDKQHKLNFYLVCDFESFLIPPERDDNDNDNNDIKTRMIDRHEPSGFCCYRVTDLEEYRVPPTVYRGVNIMETFYDHVMSESDKINEILSKQAPMSLMTQSEKIRHKVADTCANCHCSFTHQNYKVRHHDHVTGLYLFPACNNCNLQLKPKKCNSTTKNANSYFLPVIFHNLKNYDGHFLIKHFERRYTQRSTNGGKVSFDDIKIIPQTTERFLQFQIGNLKFLDSYQFLPTSLENLVSLLLKSGKDNFQHTAKYLGDDEHTFCKGTYPYSYMSDRSKFEETKLPPIESFYNTLNDEALSPEDYQRAQLIWHHYNIKNLGEYHDHYLKSDVLLLTDVFENFRGTVFEKHGLDCLYYPTLPSLAWSMALKHTKVELDLITDPEAYLMIENSIRGGIATISNRYSKANNPFLEEEEYDSERPLSYIAYWDMNNLYGKAQSEPLPIGNFKFLTTEEIAELDLMSITHDSPIGYIYDCDLEYPSNLHDSHSDYPLAPEHITVTREMLSPFAQSLAGSHWRPSKKLIPNLYNKTHYVTHYRNLQFYVKQGMKMTKIHRILSFSQSTWLKGWIDLCTAQRQNARSEFEADLAKLQANATFGKTMEQVRKRANLRLIADPVKLLKAVSKPSYREAQIINKDLVMVRAAQQKVTLNKPIAVGFCILELSKLAMYEFYYNYLKTKYQNRCSLLFTDTDSLCCQIQTADIYQDMSESMDLFDTSNFDKDHALYSTHNHRVLGKMKSETSSTAPLEFVGLRAKMYSLSCGKKSQKKAKGIKKHYVKKRLQHQSFLDVLHNSSHTTNAKFRLFRSTNHVINTVEMTKLCLSALYDKRYILSDGMHTLAYGHYSLIN